MNATVRTFAIPLVLLSLSACSSGSSGPAAAKGGQTMGPDGAIASIGTQLTVSTDKVTVPAGQEVYKCQDFKNPFGKDIAIIQSHSTITEGSHHLQVFVMPETDLSLTGFVDCPNGGLEFHDFIHGAQKPDFTITAPKGVGRFLSKTMGIRVILHVLNTSTSDRTAFADTTFTYVDPADVENLAGSLLLVNFGLSVPPGDSTKKASYTLASDIMLMGAVSHMHSRGVNFLATADTGDQLYQTDQWDEPTESKFDPPLALKAGTKISWSCDFHNTTAQTLTFGESARTNEMCNLFGSFYGGDGTSILQTVIGQ